MESERKRSIDKYHRLNYKDKQKEWDASRPWTKNRQYKGAHKFLSSRVNITKDQVFHHWNYHRMHDVFVLTRKQHRNVHKLLIIDNDTLLFTYNGELLDTKDKHEKAIIDILTLLNVYFDIPIVKCDIIK